MPPSHRSLIDHTQPPRQLLVARFGAASVPSVRALTCTSAGLAARHADLQHLLPC